MNSHSLRDKGNKMSRKLLLICCITFAHAGTLRTHNSAPAVSYSSITFGASNLENNPEPIEYSIASAPAYDTLLTTADRYLTFNTFDEQKPDTTNLNTKKLETDSNSQNVPIPSITRPPASRNIPDEPSPDFASVPSVLKTEGLSAYASFPLETSAPKVQAKRIKESVSIVKSIDISPKDPVRFSYSSEFDGLSSLSTEVSEESRKFGGLSAFSGPLQVIYSETPVNHVSVSSPEISYSW